MYNSIRELEEQGLLQENVEYVNDGGRYGSVNHNSSKNPGEAIVARTYWYRWYICLIFATLGMMQGGVWNTWSPIDESAEYAFGFTESDIDLLANLGDIAFLICMPLFMWLLHRKGLRLPVLISSFFIALGTGLRCLPLPVDVLRIFIHLGQILNGIGGCTVMAAPTFLSNIWFPPEERVTATSIAILFSYIGTGLAFVLGPAIVHQPGDNGTIKNVSNIAWIEIIPSNHSHEEKIIRHEIATLMYMEFGLCLAVFTSIALFFPNKPPSPPSASASTERTNFKEGLKALLRNKTYLVVTLTFALTVGSFGGWMGVVSVIVSPLGVSQDEAGKIGMVMTLAGCAMGMVIGWFADKFKGHMKIMITLLFIICFFAYLYYITMSQGWIELPFFEFSHVALWISCIVIGVVMNAAVPLGMELSADAAYPTSEAISSSVFVWLYNLLMFVLLLALQLSNPASANYLMLSFIGISIPLFLFCVTEHNNRLRLDMRSISSGDFERSLDKQPLLDANINSDMYAASSSINIDVGGSC